MQTNRIAAVPRRVAAAVALIALAAVATGAEAAPPKSVASTKPAQPALFYTGSPDAAAFKAACDAGMSNAKAALDRMLAVTGKRTVANTLDAYNEVIVHAYNVAYPAGLMESVHPDSAYRATAEGVTQEIDKFLTDLSLNRAVYDAIVAVDAKGLDPETRYFRERTLREFRRSGVDRDEATRKKVSELNEKLTLLSQQFSRNIRNDRRFVTVNSAEELKGVPEDYIKSHPPGEDGKIKITIETPDYIPVMKYAENADLRRKLRLERQNRAYPVNMAVLDSLILVRHELATLLGYPHWAAYVTEDKMIGTAENAAAFLDRVSKLVVEPARDEYQVYLKTKREYDPNATTVDLSEASYVENIIRKRDYDFDSQAARPYFPFASVKKGVMDLSARIFNVRFQKIEGAEVWHPSVEAYEVYDGKKLLGRFFLDLHPRDGKYQHAAQFGIHKGVKGIQIPEAALVCNFPGDRPGDPGLMEHSDVETFFHEFGHLLHSIFGGEVKWTALSGTGVERDFVEAPSQMLEEWIWDPTVLATFAKHHETGEPIPAAMVEKMRRANTFGRGIDVAYQLFLANLSLNIYNKDPKDVNTSAVVAKYERELVPFPPMEGTHMQTSFGHLDGYSAVYYTYQWSLVIAKDLFSKFDKSKLLDPVMPTKYRKTVLAPGGSKPAADVVRAFLGRDFNYDAYEAWIREGLPSKAN